MPPAMDEAADLIESVTCEYMVAVKDEASPCLTWRGGIESKPLNMAEGKSC